MSSHNNFIQKSKKLHENTYDYSRVKYINSKTNVTIGCPKQGFFNITPSNRLQGNICANCAKEKALKKRYNKFIKDSIKQHSDTYDYSLVKYKGNYTEVKIICETHGVFEQIPKVHRNGSGCSKCAYEKIQKLRKDNPTGWSYSNWEKAGKRSNNFDSFKVYIVRFWNDNEEFYKIGKTFNTIKERFRGNFIPYNYEAIKVFEGTAQNISQLEKQLQKQNKEFKYTPKLEFGGMYECFLKIIE